jgi:hypothetical protein
VGARTLTGAYFGSATAMTDESCVDFCIAQSFAYAGTEYSGECCKSSPELQAPNKILIAAMQLWAQPNRDH